eukprot:359833-Chlamydomonas_euryale.AAC.14
MSEAAGGCGRWTVQGWRKKNRLQERSPAHYLRRDQCGAHAAMDENKRCSQSGAWSGHGAVTVVAGLVCYGRHMSAGTLHSPSTEKQPGRGGQRRPTTLHLRSWH